MIYVQYRHSIPAPVDQMSASASLHKQLRTSINDIRTVQTFYSCTSRPNVCQCLVRQTAKNIDQWYTYSTDILFLHQSTECLPVPRYTNSQAHQSMIHVQYRHLVPAPVHRMSASDSLHKQPRTSINDTRTVRTFSSCTSRPDVCQCLLYKHPMITCQKNKPSTSITKPRSVVRSSMHPCPDN